MEEETSSHRGVFRDFIEGLRFMEKILGWFETWIPTLVAVGWVVYMLVYAYAHTLPNPWRSIIIWGMISALAVVTPGVMFLTGRK